MTRNVASIVLAHASYGVRLLKGFAELRAEATHLSILGGYDNSAIRRSPEEWSATTTGLIMVSHRISAGALSSK